MTTETLHARLWGQRARDWADVQEAMVRPVYDAVLAALDPEPSLRLLDVGCGAGLFAQLAAGSGAVVCGIDAAGPMLDIAADRVPAGEFQKGDLEALPYPDRDFDVVTGFNAFQFAANPSRALAEAARVVRPGGTVVVVTWGEPLHMPAASVITALRPLLPAPPANAPGPFALSDRAALTGFAEGSGLKPEQVIDVDSPFQYPNLATALRGLNSSGVAAAAIERAGEDAVTAAHAAALAPFQKPDESYLIPATFRCLIARRALG
ncbi:class I SAM-dependent methyltransferase [Tabrizicola sp.]|jgi:SAM-dependent methyltransferase|uniref:class I SAM-dependent methyltransferase n=1 Tax=Tabrizicola sp. TaxID=2005166 RepID=UPI003D2AC352